MSDKTVRIVVISLVVVACTMGAATISYFLQQRRVIAMQQALVESSAAQQDLEAELSATKAKLADAMKSQPAPQPATDTDPNQPPSTPSDETPESAPKPTTQFAFVTKAFSKDSTTWLSLDYAEFLTDPKKIEAAAKAAGDEYPPPNDYYISNTNQKLREFPVAKGAKFTIAYSAPDDTATMSSAEFQDAVAANTDQIADAGYWFTIENGKITKAVEQWTP